MLNTNISEVKQYASSDTQARSTNDTSGYAG